jgi:SAM-dependent methyltransferase
VQFVHDFLAAHLPAAQFAIDATCGNGGDTVFLCRLAQKVLAMDIQPQAIESTRRRLAQEGLAEPEGRVQLVCDSHANLLRYAAPGSADAVLFNFGWLPGAEHAVFSTAASSIPALEAALTALRTGGILSAVLYSGKCIGSDEKQAVLAWLRALPLTQYTVLICEFANWAETAPLPCFVIKK